MNVKLLRKVKRHILAEPKRLKMWAWLNQRRNPTDKVTYEGANGVVMLRPFPECGTVACIAGWTCVLSGREATRFEEIRATAQSLLGLTTPQADNLFAPLNWPERYDAGTIGDGKPKTAKVAARRIEHFIKTEGRE